MTRERAAAWAWRLSPGVLVVLVCLYAYHVLLLSEPPLQADEAGHALPAARMALALREGDWRGFVATTRSDILWPFFHAWFVAAFFLAFGISAETARTASLFAFAATLGLLPFFVGELGRSDAEPGRVPPPTLGLLSVAALLTSTFLWDLSCIAMNESLGMLLGVATLWLEACIRRRGAFWPYVACGMLSGVAFLTKYNYGAPLMGALFLAQALRVRHEGMRPLAGVSLGMGVPLAGWALLVLGFDPARIAFLLAYLRVNKDEGLRGLDSLLFYPRGLAELLGVATATALILGLGLTLLRRPGRARLASALFVALTLALLLPHPNKQLRYLAPALPVMLGLAEVELGFRLVRWRTPLPWAVAAVALVLARDPLAQIREIAREHAPLAAAARALLGFMAARAPHGQPMLLLGSTGRLPHTALTWELLVREGREPDVGLLIFPGETGWDARYRMGYPAEMLPVYATTLGETLGSGRYAVVMTLELGPHSLFLPDWLAKWDTWGQNYVRAMQDQHLYVLRDEAAFPESDARVRIYDKRAP